MSTAVLLTLSTWFGSAAVSGALDREWDLGSEGVAALTIAVQLGFAASALALGASGLADVVPARWLMAAGALVTGIANAGFAMLATDLASGLPFRVLTGVGVAAVYPIAMKAIAGWFHGQVGTAIGILIGGLTIGAALPHLLRAGWVDAEWRPLLMATTGACLAAAVLCAAAIRQGPYEIAATKLSLRAAAAILFHRPLRLATVGYLGHMWELFAMWTWVPAFLAGTLALTTDEDLALVGLGSFAAISAGALGCVVAGTLADRLGRTVVTVISMSISGACAIVLGFLYGAPTALVLAILVVWGFSVVADSAQFSAAVTELAPAGTAASALTIQTGIGFIATSLSIWVIGLIGPSDGSSWQFAFLVLAVGPIAGVVAMLRLRTMKESLLMAGGRR
jgi:MFS family permease